MTAQSDALEAKMPCLMEIKKEDAKSPDMPMDKFTSEALFLHKWCQPDREALVDRGLDWTLVEDLPIRVLAVEEAESCWANVRFGREDAMKQWLIESPDGYRLRDELLHELRFAFHAYPELQTRVSAVADGSGDADMIQDLNDLAVIGRENPEPLATTNFNKGLLEQAAEKSRTLGELRAEATVDKVAYRDAKVVRDRAYTHLKEAVDEIRRCGQFVFWKDEDRLAGYSSAYKRQNRRNAANAKREDEDDASAAAAVITDVPAENALAE
jgi:hypothetical protein